MNMNKESELATCILDEINNHDYYESLLYENLILDVIGAARLLKVSSKTIYRHIDEIPHKKIGTKVIRFLLPDLIKWFKSKD